jgi:APA family basic amino acid/polyamine antiporter
VESIQKDSSRHALKRTLGPWNLMSLGIGCIIGAGIFVLTGKAAADHAGPAIMLSFVLAGTACALAGLCYAELASVLPVSGSAYTYAYATLGEALAWVMGWLLILEYGLAASTVAVGWSGYVVSFLQKNLHLSIPPAFTAAYGEMVTQADGSTVMALFNLPAFLAVMAVTTLLYIGVSESAKVNNIIVAIKVSVVLAFIGIGAFYINPANWHPFIPDAVPPATPGGEVKYGIQGVVRAAGIIFFAYIGFEAVSTAAQEAKNPQKDMPFGILGSLAICTVLYILVCAVLTGIVPYSKLSVPDPMAVAVDAIGLGWFSILIKIGAILGLSSVMLVLIYGQTRIFYVMGRDGLLPDLFCKVHEKFKTPYLNTWLVGGCVSLVAAFTPLSTLGDLVSLGTLSAFIIVCFSVRYLRMTQPDLPRPFRTPGYPVVPLLGIAACIYLVHGIPLLTYQRLGGWFLLGVLIYIFYGQFHSRLAREENASDRVVSSDNEIKALTRVLIEVAVIIAAIVTLSLVYNF